MAILLNRVLCHQVVEHHRIGYPYPKVTYEFQAKLMTVIVDASRRCRIQIIISNCQIFPVEGTSDSCLIGQFSLLPLL